MKKTSAAALVTLGLALGAGGTAAVAPGLKGTVYVRFSQPLTDGGVRELGRTGCYDLDKVKATVESCSSR